MSVRKIRINEANDSANEWQNRLNYLLKAIKYHCNLPEESHNKNRFNTTYNEMTGRFTIVIKNLCGVDAVYDGSGKVRYYLNNYSGDGLSDDALLNDVLNPLQNINWYYMTTALPEIFGIAYENKIDSWDLNDMYKEI